MSLFRSDRECKIICAYLGYIDSVLERCRTFSDLDLSISVNAFTLEVYVEDIEVLHVVEYDKVRLIARRDRAEVLEAIALRAVDRSHFDCLERIQPKFN